MAKCVSSRAALGLPTTLTPPERPDPPLALTNVVVEASAPTPDRPGGALIVRADPVPDNVRVQIHACGYYSPCRNFVGDDKYRVLCALDALPPEGRDIAAVYVARFLRLPAGQKVSVRLVPVSLAGFAGPETRVAVRIAETSLPAALGSPLKGGLGRCGPL